MQGGDDLFDFISNDKEMKTYDDDNVKDVIVNDLIIDHKENQNKSEQLENLLISNTEKGNFNIGKENVHNEDIVAVNNYGFEFNDVEEDNINNVVKIEENIIKDVENKAEFDFNDVEEDDMTTNDKLEKVEEINTNDVNNNDFEFNDGVENIAVENKIHDKLHIDTKLNDLDFINTMEDKVIPIIHLKNDRSNTQKLEEIAMKIPDSHILEENVNELIETLPVEEKFQENKESNKIYEIVNEPKDSHSIEENNFDYNTKTLNNVESQFEFNEVEEENQKVIIEESPSINLIEKEEIKKSEENEIDFNEVTEESTSNMHNQIDEKSKVKKEDLDFNEVTEEISSNLPEITNILDENLSDKKLHNEEVNQEQDSDMVKQEDFDFNEVIEEVISNNLPHGEEIPKNTKEELNEENIESNFKLNELIELPQEKILNLDEFDFNEVHEEEKDEFDFQDINELKTDNVNEIENLNNEDHTNQNKKDDEFEFNEIQEDNEDASISSNQNDSNNLKEEENIENKENKEIPINKESDDDFNFVDEDENQNDLKVEIKTETNNFITSDHDNQNEDDDFNFVDEDENQNDEKIEIKNLTSNIKKNNDDEFDFVEESEENTLTETKTEIFKANNQNKIETPKTSFIIEGKNSETIKNLIQNYKTKYITSYNHNTYPTIKTPMTENISEFYLNIEKKNLELNKLIENIPNFKSEAEIGIRSLNIEEVIMNIKSDDNINNKKESKFQNLFKEISNETIKKLYFKFIDIKNIYINSSNKSTQIIPSNKQSLNEIEEIIKNEITNDQPNEDIRKKTTTGILQQNSGDFDFQDDEMNEDYEDEKPVIKNKIEIDPSLYAIVADTYTEQMNVETVSNVEVDSGSHFDENAMMEMLRTFSKNKENKEVIVEQQELNNNEDFLKIVNSLPNYNFMISKYVEYPDSLFNI